MINKIPTHYKIIMHSNTTEISKMINKALKEGWELYGDPFSRPAGICQAMIHRYLGEKRIDETEEAYRMRVNFKY